MSEGTDGVHYNQEMLDQFVEEHRDQAIEVVAKQFGLGEDELRQMLSDPEGTFEEHPAYEAYYRLLDGWWDQALHS